jgi:ankyrin repeat protein
LQGSIDRSLGERESTRPSTHPPNTKQDETTMPPKQSRSSQADALGTVQRLSAVFSAANSAGDDESDGGGGPRALCAAAAALKPSERAELGSVRDQKGRTLLHHAAAGGSAEAVRRVLDADYDPESKGSDDGAASAKTAPAAANDDKSRPPLDARDNSGDTALSLAAGAGSLDAVDLLLKRGACPQGGGGEATSGNTDNDDAPLTPLHRAAAAPGDSGVACVRRLLEAGARVDAPSGAAGTPLGMAALARNTPAARALLEAGAKPDAATLSGVTPLTMAAANVDEELAGVLLDAGADPKCAANGGMTPLHALAAAGLRRRARRRQEKEEEIGGGGGAASAANAAAATDEDKAHGCSAARLARRLLEKGADPDATDGGGALPIVVAAACGPAYRPLVDALLPATKARPAGFENAAASGDKSGNTSWTADNVARYAEAQLRLQEREHEAARAAAEARVASSLHADRGTGAAGGAAPGGGDDDFDAATRPFPPPRDPEILPASESQAAEIKAQGDAAFVRQDMKAAEAFYTDALKRWTQSAPLWSNRAAALLALGDAKGALDDARKARTLQRDYVKAWYREGKAASALGLWRAAAGALAEASRLDPSSDEVGEALEKAVAKARRQAAQQQQQQAK